MLGVSVNSSDIEIMNLTFYYRGHSVSALSNESNTVDVAMLYVTASITAIHAVMHMHYYYALL